MPTRRASLYLASGLFVLSGFTGLVYETVWFKKLGHAWGSSSLAMASVVATFLAGLGLGAWWFGRVADRARSPLALYGWCEVAIGALALVVPFEMDWLARSAAPLSVSLADAPLGLTLARFAATFVVIGPPCVLMGATFPLLTRQFAAHGLSVGASAAWLYAVNTLGAALGAWCAGFVLLERLGVPWTNGLAALLNFAVGAGALAVAAKVAAPSVGASAEEPPPGEEQVSPRALRIAAAATGFASVALQMLWTRELALLVGATTYAFSATVATFILGLGLGSLWFRLVFADRRRLERPVCAAAALVVLSALAGSALEPRIALAVGTLRTLRADGVFNAAVCAGVAAALQLLPTIAMGLLFPALAQLARNGAARAGHTVGSLYAWNTLGSIGGAATTALFVLPAIGGFWSLRLALVLYAVLPLILLGARNLPLATAVGCVAVLFSNWKAPDPLDTNLGAYLYGSESLDDLRATMHPLYFAEGSSCNVLVLETNQASAREPGDPLEKLVNLRVNGKIDASTGEDMPTQLAVAYVPRFLRPNAKRVVVIGMGSGVTCGASALFPGTEVTVCEIEPAILEASRSFEHVNHAPLAAPNVEVVVDDGRSFVQGHPGPWDLILSEPSNPWIAGIANLFTEEFYRTARSKLARDGILAQWIQTYSFSEREYALIARTVTGVFPRCLFVRVSEQDTLLIAGTSPLLPDASAIDAAQALVDGNDSIRADLTRYFDSQDVRTILLSRVWLDEAGLQRFLAAVGTSRVNTDANLALEFAAPRQLFHLAGNPALETMRKLAGAFDSRLQQELLMRWKCGSEQLPAIKELKTKLFQHANLQQATAMVVLGLAYEPEDAELVVDRLLFDPQLPQQEFEDESRRVIETSPMEALRLGRQLSQLGQHNAARVVFERLVERWPNSATAWVNLGLEQRQLGKTDEAETSLQKARELDPIDDLLNGFGR